MAKKSKFDLNAYPFTIRPLTEDEGGGFLCEYQDIRKCVADGETPEEALREGRDALESTLRTYEELGIAIPQPGSTGPSGKFHQRIPKSLHARLVERAAREGVSLNTLVTAMIAEGLGKRAA